MMGSRLPIEPIYSQYFGEGEKLAMKAKRKAAKKEAIEKSVKALPGRIARKKMAQDAPGGPAVVVKDGLKEVATRSALMKEAQAIGVKNFRVINKEELAQIMALWKEAPDGNPMDNAKINAIVAGAVSRWKSGWTKTPKKK